MPNWCYTEYVVTVDNLDKGQLLHNLYEKIESWTSEKASHASYFGRYWLGNIVLNSGISTELQLNTKENKYACRGTLLDFSIDEDNTTLNFATETAWGPMHKMWIRLLNDYIGINNYDITYFSTEPGMGIYLTNDDYYVDSYNIDTNVDEINISSNIIAKDLVVTETELKSILSSYLRYHQKDNSTIDELLETAEKKAIEENSNNFIIVNKWEYEDIFEDDF